MKTLVADDDLTSSLLLSRFLSPHGQCDTVFDGMEAIIAFRIAHHEGKLYDLICLDIMMPVLDGQSVLKMIREYEKKHEILVNRRVRVIMTTAVKDHSIVKGAIEAECDSYLLKPFDVAELNKHLKTLGLV